MRFYSFLRRMLRGRDRAIIFRFDIEGLRITVRDSRGQEDFLVECYLTEFRASTSADSDQLLMDSILELCTIVEGKRK